MDSQTNVCVLVLQDLLQSGSLLIVFVGGTCGSVHVQTSNSNLKELGVVQSKRNAIWRGFVHELLTLNAQDTVLCSYFAQRSVTKNDGCGQKSERTSRVMVRTLSPVL